MVGIKLEDPHLVQRIMNSKREKLEDMFGRYICSNQLLYVMQPLDEDFKMPIKYQGSDYTILILVSSQSGVYLDSQFRNQDNSTNQNLINVIIKQAFRETDLKQIGKAPRFFDVDPSHMKILT